MRLSTRRKNKRGSVLVEMAIALPIFILVVWCVIEFARLYYTSNSLSTAVREGARFAAVFPIPTDSSAAIKQKVSDAFNPFGGPPIDTTRVTITDNSQSTGSVTVTVKYRWDADNTSFPLLKLFPGDTIGFTRSATFRWEREGT
jgi:Flp pilus assembly protein TadG